MEQAPLHIQRIQQELVQLSEKGIIAIYIAQGSGYVLYPGVATSGGGLNLPEATDVLVAVPSGYPTAIIDMPMLPADSALIPHVVGGSNPQGTIHVNGRQWCVLSYHPYSGGGGPMWTPTQHGFHTYYNQVYTWLHRLI